MKRSLCILLALFTAASLLASCAAGGDTSDPRIRVTSSDAQDCAEWLSGQLGSALTPVIIGIGSDEKYGVDMSAFREDGYIIRQAGGDTLIFGKTAEGLDRAVRAYAKAVRSGGTGPADVSYHEGYPVKSLTVAGNDISEYSILISTDADELTKRAASELSRYIGDACGYYPAVGNGFDGRVIALEQITEDDARMKELGDEGFSFTVDDSANLLITGGRYRGVIYGVYDFLERFLGWKFMYDYDLTTVSSDDGTAPAVSVYDTYDDAMYDCIADAEHIDIPADTDLTVTPDFAYRDSYGAPGIREVSGNAYALKMKENGSLYGNPELNGYAIAQKACHGIKSAAGYMPQWTDYDPSLADIQPSQPCFTDPDNIAGAIEYFEESINARIAAGQAVGREINDIDVSQMDTANFCKCKTCIKQFNTDGSHSGAVVSFANAIAAAVAKDISPEIYVSILAYWGSSAPPKVTRPLPNVAVSYCYYHDLQKTNCFSHSMTGTDCMSSPLTFGGKTVSNVKYAAELSKWCEIATRVIVWIYPGTWSGLPFPQISLFDWLDSMKFMKELGVYGVFVCPAYDSVTDGPLAYVLSRLMWDCDLTQEQYEDMIRDYYRMQYGGAGDTVYDLLVTADHIQPDACWSASAFTDLRLTVDLDFYSRNAGYIRSLFADAALLADTSLQEYRVKCFSVPFIYTSLVATYDRDYAAGDGQSRALYSERWAELEAAVGDTAAYFGSHNGIPDDFDLSVSHPGSLSDSEHYAPNWYHRGNSGLE